MPGIGPRDLIALQYHGDRKDGEWGTSFLQFRRIFIKALISAWPVRHQWRRPETIDTSRPISARSGIGQTVADEGEPTAIGRPGGHIEGALTTEEFGQDSDIASVRRLEP